MTGADRSRDIAGLQRRTLGVLAFATMLGGLGVGASLSVGALLLAEVSGNDAISGLSAATFNLGAAIAGIPLARLAARRGRRHAIVTGNLVAMLGAIVAVAGAVISQWVVIAVGIAVLGVASAVQLLSRFAATDLATPAHRARDLSLVVWSISLGAIVGPNLIVPGSVVGGVLGITPLAGVYAFAFVAQACAATVVWFGLRPDPLIVARERLAQPGSVTKPQPVSQTGGGVTLGRASQVTVIAIIALAQAVMVVLMAMTPLHLKHTGGSDELIGVTLSLHIAGMYVLAPVFGLLATRLGRIPVVMMGWVLLMVSAVVAYTRPDSHVLVLVSLILLGLGWSAVTVAGATLITEVTPEHDRTKRQGASDAVMSGAGAASGALSGVLFAVGGFPFIAVASAFAIAIGVLLTVQLRATYRRTIVRHVGSAIRDEPGTAVGRDVH